MLSDLRQRLSMKHFCNVFCSNWSEPQQLKFVPVFKISQFPVENDSPNYGEHAQASSFVQPSWTQFFEITVCVLWDDDNIINTLEHTINISYKATMELLIKLLHLTQTITPDFATLNQESRLIAQIWDWRGK